MASGKHSIFTPFPKDRNCDICLRTKITRASCRRRTDTVVPRAEIFGDLKTADHKVLCGECESRNNHRYAVVVQDLATQWIQSYPSKTKACQETEKSLKKFLEPTKKPEVIYTDNSPRIWQILWRSFLEYCMSTPHRAETNGIAERAVRRIKEGTSAVLLQSGLDENWWWIHGTSRQSAKHTRSIVWWENTSWECHLKARLFRLERWKNITYFCQRLVATASVWPESLARKIPLLCIVRGENLESVLVADIEEWEQMDASEIYTKRLHVKEVLTPTSGEKFIFPIADGTVIFLEKIRIWKHPP